MFLRGHFPDGNPAQNSLWGGRLQQGVALACPQPEHSSLRTPPSESEPKHQSNCSMEGEEQREGPTGPADPGGLRCREQMPGPVEGKPNWRTPSTSEGWSGFLSTLGNREGECVLLQPWPSPPLGPINSKIRAGARGARKGLDSVVIRSWARLPCPLPVHKYPRMSSGHFSSTYSLDSSFILTRERD